jgi:flagellin
MSAVGSILTNTGALNALNSISNISSTNNSLETQLSSGLSINSPADNPAGYITAQGFTSQLNGITQAISNANQGVSLLQTAQGAIQQQIGVTQQLNSIAVEAANGTQTAQESQSLQSVVSQLTAQVSSISANTQFNNINLLDGTFSNVQFQVGANQGQSLSVSIASSSAGAIGLNASTANFGATGTFNTVNNGNAADGAVSIGATPAGSYTAGTVGWTSNAGQSSSTAVTVLQSAASVAAQVNATSSTTGIYAQAATQTTLTCTAGNGTTSPNTGFAFTLDSGGTSQTINASTTAGLISQVNGGTATTGITAALNSAGTAVVFTQSTGANIDFTNITAGTYATGGSTPQVFGALSATVAVTAAKAAATVQGQVEFQSASGFSLSNGTDIGLGAGSTLSSLASINVSTITGANAAINVVKFALQNLGNEGGQLGATQQRLTANIANLNTTSQNVTSALGVVQDANIPAVSNQLTQAQIQAQAGVAALKSSTTLQQSFLSLLP